MNFGIYLIIEDGADRVFIWRSYPSNYEPPKDRAWRIVQVDIPLPSVREADQQIHLSPAAVSTLAGAF